MWHIQPNGFTLRLYDTEDVQGAFNRREPYIAIAQVVSLGEGRVFIHSAMTNGGGSLSTAQWLELGTLLKEKLNVTEVMIERHGKLVTLPTKRR